MHRAEVASLQAHLSNLLHRSLLQYRVADVRVWNQQLINAEPPAIACEVTYGTSFSAHQREPAKVLARQSKPAKHTRIRLIAHLAVCADFSHQALRKHRSYS